ncbi:MAG: hypothetical protein VYA62_11280 [Planctomycetota bacterium]|nr:hypothetical protein [Planctomycetota bacterium]
MNRSFRAASGVLTTACVATILLVAIAVVDSRATAMHSDHGNSGDGPNQQVVGDDAPFWKQLGVLETRIDDVEERRDQDEQTSRRQVSDMESRLRAELNQGLERVPDAKSLAGLVNTTLDQREDLRRIDSIDSRLMGLAGTVDRGVNETATLREAISRLQPVLNVSVDPKQPDHFTIVVQRVPLADVLQRLESVSDWKFESTPAALAMVSVDRLDGVTIEQALEVLLPAAGCAARLQGRSVRVMSLSEARRLRGRLTSASPSGGDRKAEQTDPPIAR